MNHIRSFPDLAIVAEHVLEPPTAAGAKHKQSSRFSNNPFDTYNPHSASESQIIGYVLGKIDSPSNQPVPSFPSSRVSTGNDDLDEYLHKQKQQQKQLQQQLPDILGHVTSLAVLQPYRRKGLAALLMKQLHFHMESGHQATSVGLHVRVSNVAARRLYCEGMGYSVINVIRGYYADGEDAFFMKKILDSHNGQYYIVDEGSPQDMTKVPPKRNPIGGRWPLLRRNNNDSKRSNISPVQQNVPLEFQLPIIIPLNDEKRNEKKSIENIPAMVDDSSEEEDSRVMTGSL